MILKLAAPAKINLSLEILGKREDGYHEIATVMQTITLADSISIGQNGESFPETATCKSATFGKKEKITLYCEREELLSSDNLAVRAAALMQEEFGGHGDVTILLNKRIPLAAGLGGGSSDAAGVLQGLTRLWSLPVPREHLAALGAGLGSDVPFFLYGGACLAEGRGEKITQLNPFGPFWVVLLKPGHEVVDKTRALYSALAKEDFTGGDATRYLVAKSVKGDRPDSSDLLNGFDRVSRQLFPELRAFTAIFSESGAEKVHLTGSGPTLFCLAQTEDEARTICNRLKIRGLEAYWARSTSNSSGTPEEPEIRPDSGEV